MTKSKSKKKLLAAIACTATLAVGCSALYAPVYAVASTDSDTTSTTKYTSDYDTLEDALTAATTLTGELAAEGDVLLKNKDDALPLNKSAWVSVFGVSADALIGAAQTGSQSSSSAGGETVAEALSDAGFNVNPTLEAYYANSSASIGNEDTTFNSQVKNSVKMYNDAAIVVLSRSASEGSDASRVTSEEAGENLLGKDDTDTHVALSSSTDADGKTTTYKHYLMLTESERALIEYAESSCKKVVVVLNTSNAMEIDELKNYDGVDAIINIGRPGEGGLSALAQILNGEVNPSGGLVDEWYSDFTADPTWYNFGNNNQTGSSNTYMNEAGSSKGETEVTTGEGDSATTTTTDVIGDTEGFHGIDYEESIYLGYKYYETYYTDLYGYCEEHPTTTATISGVEYKGTAIAQAWWNENVAYAFGYGLSYTTFSYKSSGIYTDKACKTKLTDTSKFARSYNAESGYTDKIYIPVTVTNTGSVAGKKTVQIYLSAPYENSSMVERASVSLVGYAKTDTIQPGKSQTVVVEVNVEDMAAWYSYYAQSDSKTSGAYIMEAGEYTLRIMEDSHYDCSTTLDEATGNYVTDSGEVECYAEETFTLSSNIALEQDDYSGMQVSSLFTDGLNSNGSGASKNTAVDDSNFGNVRTAAMMADETSAMTNMTRNSTVSATNKSVINTNGANVTIVNYSGASVPTNPLKDVKVNGFDSSFPVAPTTNDLKFQDEVLNNWSYWDNYAVSGSSYSSKSDATASYAKYHVIDDEKGYVWSKKASDIPSTWTQEKGTLQTVMIAGGNNQEGNGIKMYASDSSKNTIKFQDLAGKDYDDPLWTTFLNQLTYDEMCSINTYGGYGTVTIESVAKPSTTDADGPNNFNEKHQWCSADVIAATWNVELAEKMGEMAGNIGLLSGAQGWYGPGADTHRSPFSGRNNEYYSQDGFQGGKICAAVINGANSKGIVTYVKHILMNDQETDRGNLFTWANEQAMRENYIKCFQLALQEGGSKAGMTAYGRIGGISNTNNTNLSVELYQNEWGSQAYFVTDGYIGWNQRTNPDMMVRAGNQICLTTMNQEYFSGQTDVSTGEQPTGGWYDKGETLPDGQTASVSGVYLTQDNADGTISYKICYTQWYCVRQMAHGVLYQLVNSAGAYNGYDVETIATSSTKASVLLKVSDGTINLTQGVSAEQATVGIDLDADSAIKYSYTGTLPDGLSLDTTTGEISGTPTAAGESTITVNYTVDGWITGSASYKIVVASAIQVDKDSDDYSNGIKSGEEFYLKLYSDVFTTDSYDTIEYALKAGNTLPEGLTLNTATGEIEGTPTTAGTYTFTIQLNATKKGSSSGGNNPWGGGDFPFSTQVTTTTTDASNTVEAYDFNPWGGSGSTDTTTTVEYTITIKVLNADGTEATTPSTTEVTVSDVNAKVDDLAGDVEGVTSDVAGVKSDVEEIKSDISEINTKLDNISSASTDTGSDSESGSGCSSSLGVSGIATLLAAFATVGAVVVVHRACSKKKDD